MHLVVQWLISLNHTRQLSSERIDFSPAHRAATRQTDDRATTVRTRARQCRWRRRPGGVCGVRAAPAPRRARAPRHVRRCAPHSPRAGDCVRPRSTALRSESTSDSSCWCGTCDTGAAAGRAHRCSSRWERCRCRCLRRVCIGRRARNTPSPPASACVVWTPTTLAVRADRTVSQSDRMMTWQTNEAIMTRI